MISESADRTDRLVAVDESPRAGSLAAEVIVRALEDADRAIRAFRRINFPDVHHPFDPRLEAALLPSAYKKGRQRYGLHLTDFGFR